MKSKVTIVVVLVGCGFLAGYRGWYQPRQQRLELEKQGHKFFAMGELDSAIARYEQAKSYGDLSETADDMYRMAQVFIDDGSIKADFYDLADSIGPKVVDSVGNPK